MYLGISIENFVTIGLMLLAWMLAVQLAGQFGLQIGGLIPGGGN